MKRVRAWTSVAVTAAMLLTSCGQGGGGSGSGSGGSSGPPFYNVPPQEALSVAEVEQIVAQGVGEAQAEAKPATIAVTDRVGNVLTVFQMNGAPQTVTTPPSELGKTDPSKNLDLENVSVPAALGAIAKALTGAYLSSGGNAFSTRTASMIIQQNFPPEPAGQGQPSGPLFGVQFTYLPCSDLATRYPADAKVGPKRSPLGLAGEPGGFPLYKNGVVVGGIGVVADTSYGVDTDIANVDHDPSEIIALAASTGFTAPAGITADKISVAGTTLRYSDAQTSWFKSNPANAPPYSTLGSVGSPQSIRGYAAATVIAGVAYGAESSGIRASTRAEFSNPDVWVLTNGSGVNRYPPKAGTDGGEISMPLTVNEVSALLAQGFSVMTNARAQIRQPLGSRAQVTIAVVDTRGEILGAVRSPDAPLFGIDTAIQKARSVSFISSSYAAADLTSNTDPNSAAFLGRAENQQQDIAGFVKATQQFLSNPSALTGQTAFANRSIANLARPYFPDGQLNTPNGPLSRPIDEWNPFSTGLQSSLITSNVVQDVLFVLNKGPDTPQQCTYLNSSTPPGADRLKDGLQIFPGAVPIYRGGVLIGGIGVSGDGVDQDDMISFLGLYNAGAQLGTINEANATMRADRIVIHIDGGLVRLLYVQCPDDPFLNSSAQNVCSGK
jgi:uncharacterized protein GlcG (DUF336 family)